MMAICKLVDDGTILWVVGHRASQYAAIDHTTKEVVRFKQWR